MSLFLILVVNCILFLNIESAKILAVFPVPSLSHQVVFRPLTQELARRGHEVTVITPNPAFPKGGTPPNLTEIDVHDISYKQWDNIITSKLKSNPDIMDQVQLFLDVSNAVIDAQLSNEDVQNLIKDENRTFDLLLIEACLRVALVFSHVYKVPVIQISSFGASHGDFETIGAPIHPKLYSSINRKKNHNFTLWEKITAVYNHYMISKINEKQEVLEHLMLQKHFGSELPTLAELKNNVEMLFLNVNPVFEGIRPVPPSVVYMGGLHQKPDEELPADLKLLLDSSKNGVIYLSFGTNVVTSTLTEDKIRILVKVLSQMPYLVLWKWDANELPGRTNNIRISKWWPQSDLLKHPNVKLFITQGGLQSTDEAITAGVPLIGIPMMGDQWFNVEKYVHHKIGIKLDMETLNGEDLKNAINAVIGDDSYRRNIVRLRTLMYDQPQTPLERAVWWTEHVLRHGGARHLRAPAANMSWTEYLELELVVIVIAVLLVFLLFFIFALYYLCKLFSRNFRVVKIKRS